MRVSAAYDRLKNKESETDPLKADMELKKIMKAKNSLPEFPSFHSLHFPSIQALRGIAALLVVMEHIRFLNCGAFGVDIFFCISGFMIMFTTHQQTKHYFLKRIIRIVPFYYIMTLGTWCLLLLFPQMFEQTSLQISHLVKSLLFIPFDIGDGILQPLLRIGWTVNCEMFFYLLFGISSRISHRYRGLICSGTLAGLVLLCCLLPVNWAPLTFYGDPVMLDFILGILCYYAVRELYRLYTMNKLPGMVSYICLFLALALFAYLILTKHHINVLGFRRLLYWSLPAFAIVLAAFTAGFFLTMPTWSVKLGDISFSLYLIHYYPILLIDRKICDFSQANTTSVIVAVLSILLVILLAYASWYLIERKFTGWLKKRLLR